MLAAVVAVLMVATRQELQPAGVVLVVIRLLDTTVLLALQILAAAAAALELLALQFLQLVAIVVVELSAFVACLLLPLQQPLDRLP
jgi:hypothetical protein